MMNQHKKRERMMTKEEIKKYFGKIPKDALECSPKIFSIISDKSDKSILGGMKDIHNYAEHIKGNTSVKTLFGMFNLKKNTFQVEYMNSVFGKEIDLHTLHFLGKISEMMSNIFTNAENYDQEYKQFMVKSPVHITESYSVNNHICDDKKRCHAKYCQKHSEKDVDDKILEKCHQNMFNYKVFFCLFTCPKCCNFMYMIYSRNIKPQGFKGDYHEKTLLLTMSHVYPIFYKNNKYTIKKYINKNHHDQYECDMMKSEYFNNECPENQYLMTGLFFGILAEYLTGMYSFPKHIFENTFAFLENAYFQFSGNSSPVHIREYAEKFNFVPREDPIVFYSILDIFFNLLNTNIQENQKRTDDIFLTSLKIRHMISDDIIFNDPRLGIIKFVVVSNIRQLSRKYFQQKPKRCLRSNPPIISKNNRIRLIWSGIISEEYTGLITKKHLRKLKDIESQ